jgi:hypothetical protein
MLALSGHQPAIRDDMPMRLPKRKRGCFAAETATHADTRTKHENATWGKWQGKKSMCEAVRRRPVPEVGRDL